MEGNTNCEICKKELTVGNIARWKIPGTEKDQTIRKDSKGGNWCQDCTDEHDSIDWDDYYGR